MVVHQNYLSVCILCCVIIFLYLNLISFCWQISNNNNKKKNNRPPPQKKKLKKKYKVCGFSYLVLKVDMLEFIKVFSINACHAVKYIISKGCMHLWDVFPFFCLWKESLLLRITLQVPDGTLESYSLVSLFPLLHTLCVRTLLMKYLR